MKVAELIDRLKLADKTLELVLENGRIVSDVELKKHPHLDNDDDVICIL
jgi:hypothetical protein